MAKEEGLDLTDGAANLIARLADGALRDALSILDQCIGQSASIDETTVNAVVGLAGRDYLFQLADSILHRNSAMALAQIDDLYNRSCDMERLCNELINHFRNLMVCKAVKNPKDLIVCSAVELGFDDVLVVGLRIAHGLDDDVVREGLAQLGTGEVFGVAAQHDVGTTTGHVGRDGDG